MIKKEILVVLTEGDSGALGNVWRLSAKKTDFYLNPHGEQEVVHLSLHGPNELRPAGHRFHVKIDRRTEASFRSAGHFIAHSIPRKGHVFEGQELVPGAFRVARIRWSWQLQRLRYRSAALSGPAPTISDRQSGVRLSHTLPQNEAADLDLVVSYDRPYWPDAGGSLRDNARLGPLRNSAGLWLTATSYRRSQMKYPTPKGLDLPLPAPGEEAIRIMSGGPGGDRTGGMYWFVESITARRLLVAPTAEGGEREN